MTNMRSLLQLSVVLSLALGTGACSTLADLDPTGLLSDDSSAAAPAGQFPDTAAPQASDAAQGTTPDLASLPSRPAATSAAQQQQAAQSLAADGAQVQYSADALRGGTEAAAPIPGAAPPPSAIALAAAPPPTAPAQPAAASDAPPTTDAPPTAAAPSAADEPPTASAPPPARAPSNALAAVPAGPVAAAPRPPVAAPAPAAAPPGDAPPSAAAPVGGSEPAVPANTPVRGAGTVMANATPSDTELGFRPSAAPPLDPSINQWVAAPIVSRYRETASNAGISGPTAMAAVPSRAVAAGNGAAGGITPTAVVYFPGDGTVLSAAARTQIRSAVQAFKAGGGAGTIRVVGHSSSRTANMPIEKHLETIFDKSQKRANAVAQELIHEGVPAAKVLVEAVGDSQPVYYESMPKGEDGNRRAEIFVQG